MVLRIPGRHPLEIVAYLPERDGKIRVLFPVAQGPGLTCEPLRLFVAALANAERLERSVGVATA